MLLRRQVDVQFRARAGRIIANLAVMFFRSNVCVGPRLELRILGDFVGNAFMFVDMLLGEVMRIQIGLLFESKIASVACKSPLSLGLSF